MGIRWAIAVGAFALGAPSVARAQPKPPAPASSSSEPAEAEPAEAEPAKAEPAEAEPANAEETDSRGAPPPQPDSAAAPVGATLGNKDKKKARKQDQKACKKQKKAVEKHARQQNAVTKAAAKRHGREPNADELVDPKGAANAVDCDPGSGYPVYLILPAAYYSEEVGLAFLIHNELQFLPEGRDTKSWPSSITFGAAYSTLNQFLLESKPTIYLKENRWRLGGTYLFRRFTDRYFGQGNDTTTNYEPFLEYVAHLRSDVAYRAWKNLSVGGLHDLKLMLDIAGQGMRDEAGNELPNEDPLLDESTPGYEEGIVHGLGGQVFWDSRDNVFFPFRGGYYHTSVAGYVGALGSDYTYFAWSLDARRFIPLWKGKHTLGFQLWHETTAGDVPFHQLPRFGGAWQMRGYRRGRYRDFHQTVLQTEYRLPLVWRLYGVAFVGVGESYGQTKFDPALLRVSGGAGLRYKVNATFFIRADAAYGEEMMVVINGGQAF